MKVNEWEEERKKFGMSRSCSGPLCSVTTAGVEEDVVTDVCDVLFDIAVGRESQLSASWTTCMLLRRGLSTGDQSSVQLTVKSPKPRRASSPFATYTIAALV